MEIPKCCVVSAAHHQIYANGGERAKPFRRLDAKLAHDSGKIPREDGADVAARQARCRPNRERRENRDRDNAGFPRKKSNNRWYAMELPDIIVSVISSASRAFPRKWRGNVAAAPR